MEMYESDAGFQLELSGSRVNHKLSLFLIGLRLNDPVKKYRAWLLKSVA